MFTLFYIQHRLLHLLVTTSLERPRITYDEFIDLLCTETPENLATYTFLGRDLTQEDLESDTVVCIDSPPCPVLMLKGSEFRMRILSPHFLNFASKVAFELAVFPASKPCLAQPMSIWISLTEPRGEGGTKMACITGPAE